MPVTLATLITLYLFSTGRRLFAMQEVKKLATAENFTALASHCDVAIDHDRTARIVEARWLGRKTNTQYSPLAKHIDILVDTALTALHDGVATEAKNSAPDDPLGQQADTLCQTLFPKGAGAVTSLNYVDQLGEVERIIATAKSPEWAPVITALGLDRRVARLDSLEPQYRSAVADPVTKLDFADVKQARSRGQSLMLQAVAMILGKYPSDSDADIAARSKLLGPILRQNEAIRDYLRGRKPIVDVDPDTGELETTPDATAPGQTQPA